MSKILYILSSSSPFGGGTKSIEIILKKLAESKTYEFGVVLPDRTGVYDQWMRDGWKVYVHKNRHSNYPPHATFWDCLLFPMRMMNHWIINGQAEKFIAQIVAREGYDIIHSNVGVLNIGYHVARKRGLKHIYHLREYQDLDFGENIYPSHKAFNRGLRQAQNYNIAITKNIFNYFGCCDRNSEVIYDGVLWQQSRSPILWNKQKYFLFVGRLSEGKGILEAISAFYLVHEKYPGCKLMVAGSAESRSMMDEVQGLLSRLALTHVVKLLGPVGNVEELMQNASALLMTSKAEGLGRVTIEAMSQGCLVIGRNAMGTKEQFDNGVSHCGREIGLRYNTRDELVQAMCHVVEYGTEFYKDMIQTAQDTVYELYTIEQCYEALMNFYRKIEKVK
jgi:glycosyltransferase involved in cell wall biosynthesis